jgi:hypothetical protein
MTLAERDRPCRIIGTVSRLGAAAVPTVAIVFVVEVLALKDLQTGTLG